MATTSIRSITDTWTDAGTTYQAIKMNVTDTASAAASSLLQLQVASSNKLDIGKVSQNFLHSVRDLLLPNTNFQKRKALEGITLELEPSMKEANMRFQIAKKQVNRVVALARTLGANFVKRQSGIHVFMMTMDGEDSVQPDGPNRLRYTITVQNLRWVLEYFVLVQSFHAGPLLEGHIGYLMASVKNSYFCETDER